MEGKSKQGFFVINVLWGSVRIIKAQNQNLLAGAFLDTYAEYAPTGVVKWKINLRRYSMLEIDYIDFPIEKHHIYIGELSENISTPRRERRAAPWRDVIVFVRSVDLLVF